MSKKYKKEDKSPKIYQGEKLEWQLNIRERTDLTDKQKELIDIILDKNTKVVFINGPSGTSKTFISILCGLKLLNNKRISDIVYLRTIAESASKSLGALPGEIGEKMEPFLMPLRDKMDELLPISESVKLFKENKIQGIPINHLRGAHFANKYIIFDEFQNANWSEAVTAITRLGEFSKMIFLFDPLQSDINGKSAALPFFDLFNDEESKKSGIHCFSFTRDDIVRSKILKVIIEKIEAFQNTAAYKLFKSKN